MIMNLLFLIVVVLVILLLLSALSAKGKRSNTEFPFQSKVDLFTPAERSFLGVLEQVLCDQYRVMGKVRLCDVIDVQKGLSKSAWQTAFNKVNRKHLDFVIVKRDDLSIAGAIELDDKSHNRKDRVERDDFLNGALESAGVSLVRFPVQKSYALEEVKGKLLGLCGAVAESSFEAVSKDEVIYTRPSKPVKPTLVEGEVTVSSPTCEKCGSEMIQRRASKGKHAGQMFWACTTFPKCRGILAIKV
jgi:hypothetical protein